MANVKFHKVTTLPATLEADSIYYVTGVGATTAEEWVVGTTPSVARQVAPLSGTAPPNVSTTTSTIGTSELRARADHTHGLLAIPATTTATTQPVGDNSTKVATTAFVQANSGTQWLTTAW
jgi:hypothetical protein